MNQHFWSSEADSYSFHRTFTNRDLSLKNENFRSFKVLYSYKAYFFTTMKVKISNRKKVWKLYKYLEINTHVNNPFIYAKTYTNIYSKFIHNFQMLQKCPLTDAWLKKLLYNGLLFSNKNNWLWYMWHQKWTLTH